MTAANLMQYLGIVEQQADQLLQVSFLQNHSATRSLQSCHRINTLASSHLDAPIGCMATKRPNLWRCILIYLCLADTKDRLQAISLSLSVQISRAPYPPFAAQPISANPWGVRLVLLPC